MYVQRYVFLCVFFKTPLFKCLFDNVVVFFFLPLELCVIYPIKELVNACLSLLVFSFFYKYEEKVKTKTPKTLSKHFSLSVFVFSFPSRIYSIE